MTRLTKASDVTGPAAVPGYVPQDHGVGIVHLGLGAFHRAHQAAMTDAALARSGGDWRIVGVSLRSRETSEALEPQNGLFTLIERDAKGARARVISSIARTIAADPEATLAALCAPEVRIVTLTVTEKAYGIDRSTGAPSPSHPAVAADLASPNSPTGVLGLLVEALGRRRAAGMAPFTVLCCDNLPSNGAFLRSGVVGFARQVDLDLAGWIEREVAFPSSMVDRITPAATDATLREAEALTGFTDLAAIETEPFTQWVIEDRFPQGRPDWEAGGAVFTDDVEPFERMKLRMLNGAHSMLAYAGFLSGHRLVREVMDDAALAALVARHLRGAAATLEPIVGVDFGVYAADLQERFRNPAIAHATYQIAMDGTEKMPQRVWSAALDALNAGQDLAPFAFATAAWMRYCLGVDAAGEAYALRDPREAEVATALANVPPEGAAISAALHALPDLLPAALCDDSAWRTAVEAPLSVMLSRGVPEAVRAEVSAFGG